MTRLQFELDRLYIPRSDARRDEADHSSALIDPSGCVRAMVLELTNPPSWELLSTVWHGVQAELDLPAPAIAVSGTDGLQLWFSLAEPIVVSQAHAFLESLRAKFLPGIDTRRIRLLPGADASAPHTERHARRVPAQQEPTGNWSAFVAADLAPVFADTPWLDIPPGDEGQATLLHALRTIKPAAFDEALNRLASATSALPENAAITTPSDALPPPPQPESAAAREDAEHFLREVMNDATVAMAHRIEAAKALLQHAAPARLRPGG